MHEARVVTLFPGSSMVLSARRSSSEQCRPVILQVELVDLRAFGKGVHRRSTISFRRRGRHGPDGGAFYLRLSPQSRIHNRVLLTPAGARLTQTTLDSMATYATSPWFGRYEGVDERWQTT